MASEYFLSNTDLDDVALAKLGDRESIDSYQQLIGEIRLRCGPDVASLFAEPTRGINRNRGTANVTWFCSYEGTPYNLSDLDSAGRQPVIEVLKTRLSSFATLFDDPKFGAVLASWLYVLSPKDIVSVGGQPVIKNWGMIPAEMAASEEAREAHYRRTLDQYVPKMPAPPFTGLEAQSFTSRLQQQITRAAMVAERQSQRVDTADPATAASQNVPLVSPLPTKPPPRLYRPWIAPLIATAIAGGIFGLLQFTDILRYPENTATQALDRDLEAQRATNEALEERLKVIRQAAAQNSCQLVPGTRAPSGSNDLRPLLPPPPDRAQVTVPQPGQPVPQQVGFETLLDKTTVLVIAGPASGSGFFISDRHIVTNNHVIAGASNVRVVSRALGAVVPARVIAAGRGRKLGTEDLAVIEIDPRPGAAVVLPLGTIPNKTAPVYAAGFPGVVLRTNADIDRLTRDAGAIPETNLTLGIVSSRQNTPPDNVGSIVHSAQILRGNSGGPLVDTCGRAVGVNSWGTTDYDEDGGISMGTAFFAVDVNVLRAFLQGKNIAFTAADAACNPAAMPPPSGPGTPPAQQGQGQPGAQPGQPSQGQPARGGQPTRPGSSN